MRGAAYPVEGFLYNGCTLYSPAANYPKYDPEKAKQLLAEAGYPNGEGLRELEYITSVGFYAKTKEYGEAIVQMMKDIGINFKLNPMESAAWIGIHEKHDVGDMTDGGFFSPAIDQETHDAATNSTSIRATQKLGNDWNRTDIPITARSNRLLRRAPANPPKGTDTISVMAIATTAI